MKWKSSTRSTLKDKFHLAIHENLEISDTSARPLETYLKKNVYLLKKYLSIIELQEDHGLYVKNC